MGFSSQSVEHVLYLSLAYNAYLGNTLKSSIVVTYPGILLATVNFARPFYHWKKIRSWLEFRISHAVFWFDNDIRIFVHYTLPVRFQSQWFLSIASQTNPSNNLIFMLFSKAIKLYVSFSRFPIKALSVRWMWQKEINIFSIEYDAWVREKFLCLKKGWPVVSEPASYVPEMLQADKGQTSIIYSECTLQFCRC